MTGVEPIFRGIERETFMIGGYTFSGKMTDEKAADLKYIILDILSRDQEHRSFKFSVSDTQMVLVIKGPKPENLRLPDVPQKRKRSKPVETDSQTLGYIDAIKNLGDRDRI